MDFSPELVERIEKLSAKYKASGQDLIAFLDGLLYADYLTYWNYIHLDTLLSLQNPRTPLHDEPIFIMYHQITELYFKLTLHEINKLADTPDASLEEVKMRLQRMNRYFDALTHSFEIMNEGMEREQFLKFRLSLIPASGFQSAQYRMIEIGATHFIRLVDKEYREQLASKNASIEEMYEYIYWKKGAIVEATGEKTLTLRQFEEKYSQELIHMAKTFVGRTLWDHYLRLENLGRADEELKMLYRAFDLNVNVNWPLQHYKSAVTYLARRPNDIAATGGTNWQKYLPPRFQKRIFYPDLWSQTEIEEWGKSWVKKHLAQHQID
ncbi:tryptophan 2,3-dioxygenase [Thermaurantimonas aggregans]|uniref:Tryptophan 2,3-dioxygenase n=1 Tax=Thermaurantimonas aggregans TaxID=2173829 RepID=A0A401XM44_9FLAO|nr:tryptophan 2,3-dioxygenase family protein [Thermaurantimonas aggregans]MCX8148088.1 tryptophan 2,3-dioxygenase family protein [Thermaurantimonas aggregans]GCD78076.1 tryptophan 2,3-dioxygenase [Thermaurantimonas aggregans]